MDGSLRGFFDIYQLNRNASRIPLSNLQSPLAHRTFAVKLIIGPRERMVVCDDRFCGVSNVDVIDHLSAQRGGK